jgi:Spy/CpxP family protein refolding chaperone
MKNRRRFVLALVALFAAAGLRAEAPAGGEDWEQKKEEKIKEMHAKLGLDADQQAKLEAHRKDHREEGRALRESLREKRAALRAELEKTSLDEPRVRALHEELKALDARAADHRLNGVLEVRKILTPEQFKKFQEMFHERLEKAGWKPGEGRKGPRERRRERVKDRGEK